MKIKYEVENLCCCCPQGCIHCGRDKITLPVAIECGECGEDCEEVYLTDDGYVCKECLLAQYSKVSVDDIAEDVSAYIEEEWERWKK